MKNTTVTGLQCPKCKNTDIWDVAKGHRLNRRHECGTAFDNMAGTSDRDDDFYFHNY